MHNFLYVLAFIMLCLGGTLTSSHAAEKNAPLITDVEEYAVFAAVLFPMEPALAANTKAEPEQKKIFEAHPMKLEGITGNRYRLSRFTISGHKPDKGSDQEMIGDYNRRNEEVFSLDEKRFLPFIPKTGMVILVDPGEDKIIGKDRISSAETTYMSRPGFNQKMTRAMLQINHVADPEMGVGYQVYLEKSPLTGGIWTIIGFELNRRY